MSSTNRGSIRNKDDLYETPEWLTEAIVPILQTRLAHVESPFVLEPAAGKGRMVRVLEKYFDKIVATDINDDPPVDFLKEPPRPEFDLIITNPPFIRAMEFVEQALKWRRRPDSVVAMMLRLNFLGSKKRAKWLREHPPAVYVTPARPSFRPDGRTDSIEYAWFLWQEPFRSTSCIDILPTEHIGRKSGRKRLTSPDPADSVGG